MTMFVDKDKALKIPIAHGQGRYYAPDSTLQEMLQNGQIVWRYCDEDGKLNQKLIQMVL